MNNLRTFILSRYRLSFYLIFFVIVVGCETTPKEIEPVVINSPALEKSPAVQISTIDTPETPKVDPREAQHEYALYLAKEKKFDKAIDTFKQLSQQTPAFKNSLTNLGLLYIETKQPDLAKKALERATQQNAQDAIAWNHLGFLHRQQGEFTAAKSAYEQALNVDQNYSSALLNYGILNDIYLQDLPVALNLYQRYLKIKTNDDKVKKWVIDLERRI